MSENEVIVEDQTIERLEPPKAGQKAIYKNCTIQNTKTREAPYVHFVF